MAFFGITLWSPWRCSTKKKNSKLDLVFPESEIDNTRFDRIHPVALGTFEVAFFDMDLEHTRSQAMMKGENLSWIERIELKMSLPTSRSSLWRRVARPLWLLSSMSNLCGRISGRGLASGTFSWSQERYWWEFMRKKKT